MKLPVNGGVLSHQFVLAAGLNLTPRELKNGLGVMKSVGYAGAVVVPATWHKDLTASAAAEIALSEDMVLQTCGLLPGNKFQPLTKDGMEKALEEVLRQFEYQIYFHESGCGGDLVCGPLDIGWKSDYFDWDGYLTWIDKLDYAALDKGLHLAIKPLNAVESPVQDNPFTLLRAAIVQAATCNRVGIHYNTCDAFARRVAVGEFAAMSDLIRMFGFANVGSHPLLHDKGISFLEYSRKLANFVNDDCIVAVETLDPEVITTLGLKDLYPTNTNGQQAMHMDCEVLTRLGVMCQ
jgi:hypothetical protein